MNIQNSLSNKIILSVIILSFQVKLFVNCTNDLIDAYCETDADCSIYSNEANVSTFCNDHKCMCINNNSSVKETCKPKRNSSISNYIGGDCPCILKDTNCQNGTCLCNNGFISSKDKTHCLRAFISMGEQCENDSQCNKNTTFSTCSNTTKICQCQQNFTNYKDNCQSVINIAMDERCHNNNYCERYVQNTICYKDKCICDLDYVANMNFTQCLHNSDMGEMCEEKQQCQMKLGVGGDCIFSDNKNIKSKVCRCNEQHYVAIIIKTGNKTRNLCENRKAIGDICSTNSDCYHFNENKFDRPAMECFLKECICNAKDGYVPKDQYCIKENKNENSTFMGGFITWVQHLTYTSGGRSSLLMNKYHSLILLIMGLFFLSIYSKNI